MLQKGFFKGVSREEIKKTMAAEGFDAMIVDDKPNFVYDPHQHEETNYLVCLEGSMQLTVGDTKVDFQPTDKLIIPHHTIHFGKVSPKGCKYLFAAKLPTAE
jgi:mannose-6-phosphate isomerase-like protein (cupin superfamily)